MIRVAATAALCVFTASASHSPAAQELLEPCDFGAEADVQCAMLRVPENRANPSGRSIGIFVAVVPATGPDPLPGPIFFFYGGPDAAASNELVQAVKFWHSMRARRDLVFIDQRGTGRSAPLYCDFMGDPNDADTYAIDLFDIRHRTVCRDRHAATHDLTRYGTADAIQDVEAIRVALGYDTINAIGESYGTRVVQKYVRRYPEHVRAALLWGAVPPSASITEGMATLLDATLQQFFQSCQADHACATAHPDLRGETTGLLERARVQGVTAAISLDQGEPKVATISYDLAIAWIRSRLYAVTEAARLPRVLSYAARGDARELVRGAIRWRRGLSRSLSEGMYESVACAEDMPFVDVEAEVAAAEGTWLGAHRVVSQQAACALWPRAVVADDVKDPVTAATPILVINGDRDPATSLDWAQTIVSHAPNAPLVVARNRSHTMAYERQACLGPIAERFVETADLAAVYDVCAAKLGLPPFEVDGSQP